MSFPMPKQATSMCVQFFVAMEFCSKRPKSGTLLKRRTMNGRKTLSRRCNNRENNRENSLSKTMPVYRADNHEASVKEIAKYQNSSMEKLVGVISTMKSFSAAVKVCSGLAGLSVDNTILMDAIVSGSTFIYVYTIIMISMSPLWQSMTPDMASKEGSKHKDIAKNMQYTLNQVSNEKIILPEAIQSFGF